MRLARLLPLLPLLSLAHAGETASPAAPVTAPATAEAPATSAEAGPQPPFIYLVARIKLTGTDLTQTIFFNHRAITTMDECEAERTAGLTTGWQHFSRYYLRTLKGISYKVDYRCVGSELQLAPWRDGVPLDNFYLVRTVNNTLSVKPFRNFFACRDALRQVSATEDIDNFCTISSQAVIERKPE